MKYSCKHCEAEHDVQPSAIDQQMNCNVCGRLNIIPAHVSKGKDKNRKKTLVYFEPGILFTSLIIFGHGIHPTLSISFTMLFTASMIFLLRNPVNSLPFFAQFTALQIRKFSSDQYLIPLWFLMLICKFPGMDFFFYLFASISIIYAGISSIALHYHIQSTLHSSERKSHPHWREILLPFYRREIIDEEKDLSEEVLQLQSNTQLKIKNKRMKKLDIQIQVDRRFNEWMEDEVERFKG